MLYEEADPLVWTSKLADRECALSFAETPEGRPICNGGTAGRARPSCGVWLVPMGVERCNRGGWGFWRVRPSLVPFTTGRAWGEGGIERPSRGVRAPP